MRQGSAPNFCPPVEEGLVYELEDENGDVVELEFLGLIIHNDRRYGFFFLVTEEEPALSSGEVVVLEVTAVDEEEDANWVHIFEDLPALTEEGDKLDFLCDFYSYDGEGLRYEIQEFLSMIVNDRRSSYKLRRRESVAIADIIGRFRASQNLTEL